MNPHVLLVAFYFPPSALSSGHLRTLGFARYLPQNGWEPVVLSAHARAFSRTDPASVREIPACCPVHRAFALDARKHLGIHGKYPTILAQPDRWASWWLGAVPLGLRLIKRYDVRAIWSSYPIMTSHCIAQTLHRLTGLPWLADFRDPVSNTDVGPSRLTAAVRAFLERRILSRADRAVFTTLGAAKLYSERYPRAAAQDRIVVIPNGFDEAELSKLPKYTPRPGPLRFVHSGALYGRGRDPTAFFEALSALKRAGALTSATLHVTLRGAGNEREHEMLIDRCGIRDLVTLGPPVPYEDALAEQAQADALLLFQGKQFDRQVPAKLYEYLRLGRPIFAMVDPGGDTAALLNKTGGAMLVPMSDDSAIKDSVITFLKLLEEGHSPKADEKEIKQYSRENGAAMLAKILDNATAHRR